MKNILMISHLSSGGGAETIFEYTVNILLKNNYNVYIILPKNEGYLYEVFSKNNKIKKLYIFKNYLLGSNENIETLLRKKIIKNFFQCLKIKKIIKDENIDIIYSSTIVNILPAILSKLINKRLIWHIHEIYNDYSDIVDRKVDFILKYFWKTSENIYITNISKENWEKRLGKSKEYKIIYNPIKSMVNSTRREEINLTIGFVGSFSKRKNIGLLLRVIEKLQKKYRLKILMCGNGIVDGVNKLEKENNIKLKDLELFNHIKMDEFYQKIGVIILPSLNEPWGLVITEAMTKEIIPIVTKESGLIECFQEEKNIFYFDPKNEDELYSKIEKVIELSKREKLQIIENNKKVIKEYKFNKEYEKGILDVFRK